MNQEKIKRKIAEGYTDEDIANMAGISAEEVSKMRAPAPKPTPKKAAPKPVAPKKPAETKKGA